MPISPKHASRMSNVKLIAKLITSAERRFSEDIAVLSGELLKRLESNQPEGGKDCVDTSGSSRLLV